MASLNQNNDEKLYCVLRKEWVVAQPEERIRQALVMKMIKTLGYPPECLVLEQALNQMPHLASSNKPIPYRRLDVVCFAKGIHPVHDLYPLLLIECKAVKLGQKVINQVVGYNQFIEAYFIAVANGEDIRVGWYNAEKGHYDFINFLPKYQQLVASVSKNSDHRP